MPIMQKFIFTGYAFVVLPYITKAHFWLISAPGSRSPSPLIGDYSDAREKKKTPGAGTAMS